LSPGEEGEVREELEDFRGGLVDYANDEPAAVRQALENFADYKRTERERERELVYIPPLLTKCTPSDKDSGNRHKPISLPPPIPRPPPLKPQTFTYLIKP